MSGKVVWVHLRSQSCAPVWYSMIMLSLETKMHQPVVLQIRISFPQSWSKNVTFVQTCGTSPTDSVIFFQSAPNEVIGMVSFDQVGVVLYLGELTLIRFEALFRLWVILSFPGTIMSRLHKWIRCYEGWEHDTGRWILQSMSACVVGMEGAITSDFLESWLVHVSCHIKETDCLGFFPHTH